MSEERVRGERVYDGRILDLDVDVVRMANGAEVVREVVRHPGAAVVLPIDSAGRVTLVSQYRYPVGRTLLELPAGKLERGEDPAVCARRELAEETGLGARRWRELGAFYTAPGFSDERLFAFVAADLHPVAGASPDHDEEVAAVTMSLPDLAEAVRTGAVCDAKTLATLHLAALAGELGDRWR